MSRLIEADYNNGSSVLNYGYDVAGNLVDFDGTTRTFNEANQMTNDGTNTLTYDDNGNLTGNGSDTYTWDRANRLLSVGNHSYAYDGLGNRVQQTVSSIVTDYLNDVQPSLTKLLAQSTGANVDRFVHGVRGIHAVDDGTNWNYHAQDGLGSVRATLDDAGIVQSSMSYDPYGMPLGTLPDNFGFTGEQTDENGSVFLRARYYEPQLGIFSALDPFEGKSCTPMSLNGYGYVHGNPIMNTDPSGMMPNGFRINMDMSGLSSIIQSWTDAYKQLLTIPSLSFVRRMNSGMCDDGGKAGAGLRSLPSRGMPTFYRNGGSDVQQICDSVLTPWSTRAEAGCTPMSTDRVVRECNANCRLLLGWQNQNACRASCLDDNMSALSGCKIEILSFEAVRPNIVSDHAFILFTPAGGNDSNATVIRGGGGGPVAGSSRSGSSNSNSSGSGSSGSESSGSGSIIVHIHPNATLAGDYEAYQEYSGDRILIYAGDDACNKLACLREESARINSMGVTYNPAGPNSNTAARTLLTRCGLPDTHPVKPRFAGWEHTALD